MDTDTTTPIKHNILLRQETAARNLVCQIIIEACDDLRLCVKRGIVAINGNKVSFNWPDRKGRRKTKGGDYEFSIATMTTRKEVQDLVRFFLQEENSLFDAVGLTLRGMPLIRRITKTKVTSLPHTH